MVATAHSFRYSCVKAILQRDGELCHECVGKVLKLPAIRHRCYKDSLPGSVAMASSLAIHRSAGTFSQRVDRFIALTPFMRDLFIAEGIPEERVTVIFNAAPDPGPPRNETRGYAAFVGRFVAEKGVRTILRAWELLDAEIPIILAGDGPLRPEIEAAAALDHRITVLPWLSSTEVTELLARADISIVASEWYEGLGLVIPESFAVGTPVLASDVGNFCDLVIPGHSGDHFRSGDATDLARAIGQFFEVADRTSFRTNVRREYDSMFSPQLQLDRLEALYDTVIAEHASGR